MIQSRLLASSSAFVFGAGVLRVLLLSAYFPPTALPLFFPPLSGGKTMEINLDCQVGVVQTIYFDISYLSAIYNHKNLFFIIIVFFCP